MIKRTFFDKQKVRLEERERERGERKSEIARI